MRYITIFFALLPLLFVLFIFIVALFHATKESGWHQCPGCDIWHHPSGGTSIEEPADFDGVKSEHWCPFCERVEKIKELTE